ncbi:MAG: dirigent protein [Solirubrobacteraceae bacterium]
MKITKRRCVTVAVLGSMAATAAIAVPSGSAQGPGATTLSFYEPDAQSIFKFQDNPPKSPTKRLGPKYRFSIGDKLIFSSPLFDKKGGTRQGRLYGDATIIKGGSFETAAAIATGTYVLNDRSQISFQGYFSFNAASSTAAVVGGTGRFEGARGHLVNTKTEDSSTDTLTLLP